MVGWTECWKMLLLPSCESNYTLDSTTGWAGYPTPSNEPFNKTPMQRLPCDSLEPSHQLWGNSFQQTEWIPSTCDGPKLIAVPFLLFWDRSQCQAHAGMALLKVTNSPHCVWLVDVCHAATGEELWAKYTPEHMGHSPSWGQACLSDTDTACRKAPWHWKQKSFGYRPSNSSSTFPQADLPAHLCLLSPLGHSAPLGVQAPQPIQSWRRLPTKVPRSASCITTDKLNKVTWTVIMSLQKRTVVLEPGSWPQRCGKEVLTPWEHRGKEIKLKSFCVTCTG